MLLFPVYEAGRGDLAEPMRTFASEGVLKRRMIGIIEAPHGSCMIGTSHLRVPRPDQSQVQVLTAAKATEAAKRGDHGLSWRPNEGG